MQQRSEPGQVLERAVGVPQLVARLVHALAALGTPDRAFGGEVGNIGEYAGEPAGGRVRVERALGLDRPDALGEGQLLLRSDVLLGEYQHRILPESILDR